MLVAHADADTPRRTLLLAAHAAAGPGSVVGEHDGHVVALLPSADPHEAAAELARRLSRLTTVTVGAAGPTTLAEDVPAVWREAVRTVSRTSLLGLAGTGASAGHLGFAGLVVGSAPDVTTTSASTSGRCSTTTAVAGRSWSRPCRRTSTPAAAHGTRPPTCTCTSTR